MPQVQPVRPTNDPLGATTVDRSHSASRSTFVLASSIDAAELDDAAVLRLLAAQDDESRARLALWLKANARTFAPVVERAIHEEPGLSAEAASAVLEALVWRAPADPEMTLRLLEGCLDAIAERIAESLGRGAPGMISDSDDALVGAAVAVLTSRRPSRHSETAITRLAEAGPAGALVLARAFDGSRSTLKLSILRRMKPADVLELGDNVVASLAQSASRLAEQLERPDRDVVTRFLAELGSVQLMEPSEIGVAEPLEPGDRVFHASWGAGQVIAADDESATIDFGSAGTRTLLRTFAKLRRAT